MLQSEDAKARQGRCELPYLPHLVEMNPWHGKRAWNWSTDSVLDPIRAFVYTDRELPYLRPVSSVTKKTIRSLFDASLASQAVFSY